MRKPYLAALAAAGAMGALTGAARAADHQYYSVLANEDQAVLIDLSTRSRTGDLVTFDLIVLQRQASTATGQPTYWVDGVQEVDCAQHRTRIMLVSAYSLDRSRKINSPGAAFRPWTGNAAGSDTRAIEDFACRGTPNAAIRPVADLAAFQRDYFQRGAQVATAPAQAPPAAKPPAAAGATPAADLIVVEENAQGATIVNRASRRRQGDFVTIDAITLLRQPTTKGDFKLYWVEAEDQVDCHTDKVRAKTTFMHTLTMDHQERVNSPEFGEWNPIDPQTKGFEALACEGIMAGGFRRIPDLQSYQRSYFQSPPAPAQTAAAGPRPPVGSRAAASGPRYYVFKGDDTADFVPPAEITRQGVIATAPEILLKKQPLKFGSLDAYWIDSTSQIDCQRHRIRSMMRSVAGLNRSGLQSNPEPKYGDWDAIEPLSTGANLEALFCRGAPPAGVETADDLIAYQRTFFTGRPPPRQTQARAPSAPPRAPPSTATGSTARTEYRMADVGKDGALLLDRASVKRTGDIVAMRQMQVKPEAGQVNGKDYWWVDESVELDCKTHRNRTRIDDFLSLDRKRHEVEGTPRFSAWRASEPDTLASMIEDFVCRGKGEKDFEPVPDLDEFRSTLLAAIKAGAFDK